MIRNGVELLLLKGLKVLKEERVWMVPHIHQVPSQLVLEMMK